MGKSVSLYVDLKDSIFQTPRNSAVVQLFNYPATLSDGTITGTQAVSSDGTTVVGYQSANRGRYHFRNIPSGKYYTVVVSGGGITTFVPEGFEKWSVTQAPDFTGTDVPWKDGEVDSIATKIESLSVGSSSGVNLGDGTGVFFQKVGSVFQFKTLKSGANMSISTDSSTITFTSAQDGTTNTRLSVLEASDIIQDVEIADLTTSDGTQNTRLTSREVVDGTQNTRLTVVEGSVATNSSNITTLQTSDGTQNTRLTAIESKDGTQDTTLTALISSASTNSSNITTLQTSDGTQNTRLTTIEGAYASTGVNVGTGEGLFIDKSGTTLRFKPLKQGSNITLTSDSTSVTIASSASGEVNTASNLGAGTGVFAQKSGVDLQFKSLRVSSDSTVSTDTTTVTISRVTPTNIKYVSPAFSGLGAPYYTTPALAVASAVSGDLIIVFPATYDGAGSPCITLKDGVNWYLHKGVTLTNTSGTTIHTITDGGASITCTISGEGDISRITAGTGSAVYLSGASTNFTLYCNTITNSQGVTLYLGNYPSGISFIKAKSISCTGAFTTISNSSSGTIEADTITGTSGSVVTHSAGTVYLKVKEVSTATSGVRGVYMDNTGTLHIMCNRIKTTSGNPIRKDGGTMYLYGGLVLVASPSVDTITAGTAQNVSYYGTIVGSYTVNANITNIITGTSLINDTDVA